MYSLNTYYTHSATTTDNCPQRSYFHMKAETWTGGDPCSLSSQLPRSGFWVRLYSPTEQRESLGCQDIKHYRAAGFLKQGNENLPLPELTSPLLLAHSHHGVGKSSETPFHSAFVSTDQSPRFDCVYGCISDRRTKFWCGVIPWRIYCYLSLCCSSDIYYIVAHVLV